MADYQSPKSINIVFLRLSIGGYVMRWMTGYTERVYATRVYVCV